MFGLENINGWEVVALLLLALFIFGPDKLPKAISDGVRMVRQLRQLASNAAGDLSRELGTEIQVEDLHPKTFIRKHLLSEEDERALRAPVEKLYREVSSDAAELSKQVRRAADAADLKKPVDGSGSPKQVTRAAHEFDADAT
ncbi:MAG TPA: preprotein translocase subunit TatB [Micromonosporaceae bacterium]